MSNGRDNLTPWKPGQTGNPDGHSRKRRQAKKLREALDIVLESSVPDELLDTIPDDVRAILPENMTFAEIIALRVAIVAARASNPAEILSAANLIMGAQSKPDYGIPPQAIEPPKLESTEERRQAIADQLGLSDDETIH